ncbi:MAG: hypothetical protein SOS98_04435 [Varibaculum sp.]|nr:hypothetical protein [Varibaculum sp.]
MSFPQETQQALLPIARPKQRVTDSSITDPVAEVLVDTGLAHLNYPVDYLIPENLDNVAIPGVRVRVRYGSQKLVGYLLGRKDMSERAGRLRPVDSIIDSIPVFNETTFNIANQVARRYAGLTTDLLRQLIPHRRKRAEEKVLSQTPPPSADTVEYETDYRLLEPYRFGVELGKRLANGEPARAVMDILGNHVETGSWRQLIAQLTACVRHAGKTVLIIVPNRRLAAQLSQVFPEELGEVGRLDFEDAQARYGAYLQAVLNRSKIVIGTRSAILTPMPNLGAIFVWDEQSDSYQERHAPYWHLRQLAVRRAIVENCGLVFLGYTHSVTVEMLLESGWAPYISAPAEIVRDTVPRINIGGRYHSGPPDNGWIPDQTREVLREALTDGPVLISTPNSGYRLANICGRCGEVARCRHCNGPVGTGRRGTPYCRWCGRPATGWNCPNCNSTEMRALGRGAMRGAEELGRAFPGVPIIVSGRDQTVIEEVDSRPRIVLSTPGAEPSARGGYAGGAITDAARFLSRPELWVPAETMRRWTQVAALLRPQAPLALLGSVEGRIASAFQRWDTGGWSRELLDERRAMRFTPTVTMAAVSGDASQINAAISALQLPDTADVLGPVPIGMGKLRAIIRVEGFQGLELADALTAYRAQITSRHQKAPHIQVDPDDL